MTLPAVKDVRSGRNFGGDRDLHSERPQQAGRLRLVRWLSPDVLSAALLATAAGFGQLGAVAALGDVANTFGHATAARRSPSKRAGQERNVDLVRR